MKKSPRMNFKGKKGPLLIAEIGGNHEGNFEYAKELTQKAIECDVDFIKFQLYTGDTLVSSIENPKRNVHFKKFELTKDQHISLAKMVQDAGIGYMASVWNVDFLDWIDDHIQIYKIGSGDLTAYPVLNEIAQKNKPIILSTGLSSEEEVLNAVKYLQKTNPIYKQSNQLAILQCTSMYPIEYEDAHLSVMNRLKEMTYLTVGYSDHTIGLKTLSYAYAMGAEVLEFHFTDTREDKTFRDHFVSLTPEEVGNLKDEITFINKIKGNPIKKPLQIEKDNNHIETFRRAIYPSKDIKKGEKLTQENITVLRPNKGIDAREYENIVNKTTTIDLKKHQKIDLNNLK